MSAVPPKFRKLLPENLGQRREFTGRGALKYLVVEQRGKKGEERNILVNHNY